jgi:alpha-D-ribose 1-methylphosphonate 5-triphosphate diphosphatase
MSEVRRIYGGKVVTPYEVIDNGTLIMEENKISAIERKRPSSYGPGDIDASGAWVLPGLIDSHSDAIESELQPRPSSHFPIELSFYELEKKLVGEGITTIYHSLSLQNRNSKKWVRQNESVIQIIEGIRKQSTERHLITNKIHLRYEISNCEAVPLVIEFLEEGKIDQLSFMDHTPGQGQFRDLEVHKRLLVEHRHMSEEEAMRTIQDSKNREKVNHETLCELAEMAHANHIPLASHDDDSVEKLALIKPWKTAISEFPIDLEVAIEAKNQGLFVVMGAPNVLLGRSHSNNLSALDAINHEVVDILCSDYYPSSLLHAVYHLYHQGFDMPEVVNMVSANPARALNLSHITGSLEAGKQADVLIVREHNKRPMLQKVFANGQLVCQMDYQKVPVIQNV